MGSNCDILRQFSLSSKQSLEKPELVKGVRDCCPPFLMKIFEMVEDPGTNFLISWSSSGTSFIIWDHLKFSAELLPRYFKHSNLSSFIYQLNNYGFKKIGLRQYEYENKLFQAGQEHLLKNIKRRNEHQEPQRQRRSRRYCLNDDHDHGMEAELENLRNKMDLIKVEIQKLKHEKGDFENHAAAFKQLVEDMETKSEKMALFLTKAFGSSFVQQITQLTDEEGNLESPETVKNTENSSTPTDELNIFVPLGKIEMSCLDDSGYPIDKDQEANNPNSEAIPSKNCDALIIWKKFLEDDKLCENEAEKELAQQGSKMDMALDYLMASKVAMEVEDVIAKQPHMDVEDEVTLELWT